MIPFSAAGDREEHNPTNCVVRVSSLAGNPALENQETSQKQTKKAIVIGTPT